MIQYTLAGRGQRFLASFFDIFMMMIISVLFGLFFIFIVFIFTLIDPSFGFMNRDLVPILSGLLQFMVPIIYQYLTFVNGQTWGKKLLKIKVVNQDGSLCTKQHYIYRRWLLFGILMWVTALLIGLLCVAGLMIIFQTNVMNEEMLELIFLWSVMCVGLTNTLMIFRATRSCLHDDFAKTMVVQCG